MNIKSLLIGSAAALAAVSGAQAADAIVAAEPEPMEYVRVCDAFGTGFFYIPGTETCLQISGEVRFGLDFGRADPSEVFTGWRENGTRNFSNGRHSDWNAATRARVKLDARNDTEYGTLQSVISFEATNDAQEGNGAVGLREAYIDLAGLRVGSFLGWWDDDIAGESDILSNVAKYNSIRYTYDGGAFTAGLSIDEIEGRTHDRNLLNGDRVRGTHNDVGVSGMVGGAFGGVNVQGLVAYDNAAEEWAARGIVTAEIGPGTLGLAGVWASDPNSYYNAAEWSIAASYAAKVSEKLTITPAVAYYSDINLNEWRQALAGGFSKVDAWGASLLAEYDVTTGLKASAAVTYFDPDVRGADSEWGGFVRLTRSF